MRRTFLLVHNPIAGIAGRRLVDRVTSALQVAGARVVKAPAGADGPDLSALDGGGFDAVIAAGGDGTFRALAKTLGPRLPIGFLPMGTGNVLACEIRLPRGPAAIAEVFMHGPAIGIEGARANGEPFFLMAGAGFDGDVIGRLDTGLKRRIGKAAYVGPVLGALGRKRPGLQVEVDGVAHEAGWVVVAKSRCYGGSFVIAPKAGLLVPHLVAVLFKSRSRVVRLRQLLALGSGLLTSDPGVEMIDCASVRIVSEEPAPVEIDGDPFAATPLEVLAGGPRASLIVPGGGQAR
ncbi:MAG: diacylglycerol/lipid kinase family protein [Hyphomicrobium sp.]